MRLLLQPSDHGSQHFGPRGLGLPLGQRLEIDKVPEMVLILGS